MRFGIVRGEGESLERYAHRVRWMNTTVEVGTPQDSPVVSEWGSWLRVYPWEAWGTLTFKAGDFTHEAATRAWGNFSKWLDTQAPLASWFVGHEVGARGRLHLHCLLGMLSGLPADRSEIWKWWFTRYGRAQVLGYDPERGAAHYVSKYVTKELAHYDFDFRGFTCLSQIVPQRNPAITSWRERGRGRG